MLLQGIEIDGIRYEHQAEADAGIYFSSGQRWWGTRIRYRRLGIADKRWTKVLAVDVHPFDFESIRSVVETHVTGETRLPEGGS